MNQGNKAHAVVTDSSNTRTVVSCRVASADRPLPIEFDCEADIGSARRWMGAFRRIEGVEFVRMGDTAWRCSVQARGHRIPVTRSVPLRVALGLAILGIPALALDHEAAG